MGDLLSVSDGKWRVNIANLEFCNAYALWEIGGLHAIDMVRLANIWLNRGIYSEKLTAIYDVENPTQEEVSPVFEAAISELKVTKLGKLEAAKHLVRAVLEQISQHKVPPHIGAEYIYWNIHHEITDDFPDGRYLGSNLHLEGIFMWLVEYWDCEDGSHLNYHADIPRPEASEKFKSYIIEEAEAWLEAHGR